MLEISGLVKRYPSGPQALRGVDLTVKTGELVALIGTSGAGKSTLVRCINRLVEPTEGKIRLDGTELTALDHRELRHARRNMGMIFQEYALVDRLSVMENVLSGRLGYVGVWKSAMRRFPPEDVRRALELLERVGLREYVDTRADQLSGGQRQRVGIARALEQQPALLLVDEPTSSLDPKTARQIMRLIVELVKERGLSMLINIHDVNLATMFTERIVGLQDGKIVFEGTPEELNEEALTKIYGEEDWHAESRSAQAETADNGNGEKSDEHVPLNTAEPGR